MSAASTKASALPRVGTVMAPSMTGTCSSLKFCITHAGRRIECMKAPRHARSSSTARMSTSGVLVAAVGAEVRNVPHPGTCGKIEEIGHQAGVLDPHDGRDEVDAVDAVQGTGMRSRVVPVEQHVGAVARGRTRNQTPLDEFLCH